MTPEAYILCTAPRSGSTLLCRLLTATGVAGRPGSYFHRPDIAEWLSYFALKPVPGEAERDTVARVIEAALAKGRAGGQIFALRLQAHSLAPFRRALGLVHPEAATNRARIEAAFGRTRYVWLRRADTLAQAISYEKARQSGLWHVALDGTEIERLSPPAQPRYDAAALRVRLLEMQAYDRAWAAWFDAERIQPLELEYADLAQDPHGTLRHVLSFLDLDPAAASGVVPEVARLSDAVSADWKEWARRDLGLD